MAGLGCVEGAMPADVVCKTDETDGGGGALIRVIIDG